MIEFNLIEYDNFIFKINAKKMRNKQQIKNQLDCFFIRNLGFTIPNMKFKVGLVGAYFVENKATVKVLLRYKSIKL
jgi:hypothetical protein